MLLQSPEEVFMEIRRPLEWHCKQMDHFVGLNFSANFNFALVGHLLKGKAVADKDKHSQAVIQCSVQCGFVGSLSKHVHVTHIYRESTMTNSKNKMNLLSM